MLLRAREARCQLGIALISQISAGRRFDDIDIKAYQYRDYFGERWRRPRYFGHVTGAGEARRGCSKCEYFVKGEYYGE